MSDARPNPREVIRESLQRLFDPTGPKGAEANPEGWSLDFSNDIDADIERATDFLMADLVLAGWWFGRNVPEDEMEEW